MFEKNSEIVFSLKQIIIILKIDWLHENIIYVNTNIIHNWDKNFIIHEFMKSKTKILHFIYFPRA